MVNRSKKLNYLSILSFALPSLAFLIGVILWGTLFFRHVFFHDLFSTDQLFHVAIIREMLTHGVPFHAWYPTTNAYLFPPAILEIVGYVLSGGNAYWANSIAISIQLIGYFLVSTYFYRFFFSWKESFVFASFFLLSALTLFAADSYNLIDLVGVISHAGLFLISICLLRMSLGMHGRDIEDVGVSKWILLILLFSLLVASDLIFIMWYVAPMLVCLAAQRYKKNISPMLFLVWVVTLIYSVVIGKFFLRPLLLPGAVFYVTKFHWSRVPENLVSLFFKIYNMPLIARAWFISAALMFPAMWFAAYRAGKSLRPQFRWLVLFCTVVSIVSIFATLMKNNTAELRYFKPAYMLPTLFFPLTLRFLFGDEKKWISLLAAGVVMTMCVIFLANKSYDERDKPITLNYLPASYRCIYRAASKYDLKHGIARYFDTLPILLFAPRSVSLDIAAYHACLLPHHWGSSRRSYRNSYDFALIKKGHVPKLSGIGTMLDEKKLRLTNGRPDHVVHCGRYKILAYKHNMLFPDLYQSWMPVSLLTLVYLKYFSPS